MTVVADGRRVAASRRSAALPSGRRFAAAAVAACAAVVAVVHDPSVLAAEPKRVALVIAALAATALAPGAGARRRVPPAWWAAAAFLALSALSATYGVPSGLLDLAAWLGAGALAVALARAGAARARRAAILSATAIGGATSLWAIVDASRGLGGFALHAGQGNPNTLGLVACVALPLTVDAALSRRARWPPRLIFGAVAVAEVATLFLAHSRTALVAAAAATAWLGVSRALERVPRLGGVVRALAAAGAAALVGLALLARLVASGPVDAAARSRSPDLGGAQAAGKPPLDHDGVGKPLLDHDGVGKPPLDRTRVEDVSAGQSLAGRRWIWARAVEATRDVAPLGAGLGDFSRPWLEAQGRVLASLPRSVAAQRFVHAGHAHDELLQVAVESGPLAALALAAAIALSFFAHARARWTGGGAALLAVALAMLADMPLRSPPIAVLVALVIAAERRPLEPAGERRRAAGSALPRMAPVATLAAAACLSGLLFVATRSWIGGRIRASADTLEPLERLAALSRSRRIDPGSADAAAELGFAELAAGRPTQALAALRDAERLGADVATIVATGEAHRALGDAPLAVAAYARALALAPGSVRALSGFARASRAAGAFDDAERAARAAVALAPGSAAARDLLDDVLRSRFDAEADDR